MAHPLVASRRRSESDANGTIPHAPEPVTPTQPTPEPTPTPTATAPISPAPEPEPTTSPPTTVRGASEEAHSWSDRATHKSIDKPTRHPLRGLRMDLRKAVRFAQQQEQQEQQQEMPTHACGPLAQQATSQREGVNVVLPGKQAPEKRLSSMMPSTWQLHDDHDHDHEEEEVEMPWTRDGWIPMLADEEEAFLLESPDGGDEFLRCHIPTHAWSHRLPREVRAPSVPCSPPVPIPQKQGKRGGSAAPLALAVTGQPPTSSFSSTPEVAFPTHDMPYSRSQCEARLWDEHWNYKLSLESRESFEASTRQRDGRFSGNHTPKNKLRTDSEASTEDTNHDNQSIPGEDDDLGAVFDMDDV